MKKIKSVVLKTIGGIFILLFFLVVISGVSPIYNFRPPKAFSGPDIFNPYATWNDSIGWKRSVFHTHTRVKGPIPMNECPYWPGHVDSVYRSLHYDIITFSNHNELTTHQYDSSLQVNVYEHGYNLFKYHKCVFGCNAVMPFDHLLPLLASQKQFQLELLSKSSDIIQMNHPFRTIGTSPDQMSKLSNYQIMELDSGVSTENEYWDWALSAGHYSFGLANDDLHQPDVTGLIAVRCNFLNTPSGRYEDIRRTLLSGCFYAMRVPDYGAGDWEVKRARNRHLPFIKDIGLRDSTVYMVLSVAADSIKAIGQDHKRLALVTAADSVAVVMPEDEPYVRLCAYFPEGEVIYTNPFARYDASVSAFPFNNEPQEVNVFLTILYLLLLLLSAVGLVILFVKMIRK